jgi:hypothetical protein
VQNVRPVRPAPDAAPAPRREPAAVPDPTSPEVVRLPRATRRVHIGGTRLDETARHARLNQRPLDLHPVDGGVEVDLGDDAEDGTLELDLGDDGVVAMALEFDPAPAPDGGDPWRSS